MIYTWLICIVIVAIYFVEMSKKRHGVLGQQTPHVRPRPANIIDCGYAGTGGWYDIQKQGVKNDYCRTVGDNPKFTACVLASESLNGNQYVKVGPHLGDREELAPGDVCYRN